jgi:hypothetical protein
MSDTEGRADEKFLPDDHPRMRTVSQREKSGSWGIQQRSSSAPWPEMPAMKAEDGARIDTQHGYSRMTKTLARQGIKVRSSCANHDVDGDQQATEK